MAGEANSDIDRAFTQLCLKAAFWGMQSEAILLPVIALCFVTDEEVLLCNNFSPSKKACMLNIKKHSFIMIA